MKNALSFILAVCLMMSVAAVPALAKEPGMPFTDVKEGDWFYSDVASAYATGLVNGKTDTLYKPGDNMTYAEAIKLAACMHQYTEDGEVTLKNGDPWYSTYVNYAQDNGIIRKEYAYNDNASRSGYMEIFAECMELDEINYIEEGSIPDVKATASFAPAVYKLYRAGILTGVDDAHNCNPYDSIKRSEVAAILTRMMSEDARKKFTMGDPANAPTEAPEATEEPTEAPVASEAPAAEFKVTALPEEVQVSLNQPVELKALATGGKAPYTYQWKVFSRNADSGSGPKFKTGDYVELDSEIETKDGFPKVKYADDSITFTVRDKSFFNTFSTVSCTVADADGKSKAVSFQLKYAGSEEPNELATDTFLMYVEDKVWISDRGLVVTGRITNGVVKVGDVLKLMKHDGTGETVKVEGIEMFRKTLDKAEKGDNVGLWLNGLGVDSETAKAKVNRGEALIGYNDKLVPAQYMGVTLKMLSKEEGGLSARHAGDGTYKPQMYLAVSDYTVALENYVWDSEKEDWVKSELVPGETYETVALTVKNGWVVAYPGQTGTIRENGVTIGEFTVYWVDTTDYYDYLDSEEYLSSIESAVH